MDRALGIKQVAEFLGVPERTAYHYAKTDPDLKVTKIGRHLRVLESDLMEWVASKKLIKEKENERSNARFREVIGHDKFNYSAVPRQADQY